jgi:hypothetical protein
MRKVTYATLQRRVASQLGLDADNLDSTEFESIRDCLSEALEEIWRSAHWSDIKLTEQRRYAPEYNSGTAYSAGDVVYHIGSDDYYQAIQDTTGNAPASQSGTTWTIDTEFWAFARGRYDGEEYSNTTAYVEGDQVRYSPTGTLYQCHTASTGNLPTDTDYWGALDEFAPTIEWTQEGKTPIGEAVSLHQTDPRINAGAPEIPFDTTPDGIQPRSSNAANSPFLVLMRRPHRFTGDIFDSDAVYTAVTGDDATTTTPSTVTSASSVSGFPGIVSLRATPTHTSNQMAYLLYAITDGDGGEGWFRFKGTDSTADDGIDYIKPDDIASGDPGRWVRTS